MLIFKYIILLVKCVQTTLIFCLRKVPRSGVVTSEVRRTLRKAFAVYYQIDLLKLYVTQHSTTSL